MKAQQPRPMPLEITHRGAVFDTSGKYRYGLTRRWGDGAGAAQHAVFVLLNPSTADAARDDPTIRRCVGFARAWGCASLEVVNLFAWRATRPAELRRAAHPVGAENDAHLLAAAQRADVLLLAWGVHGALHGRDQEVLALLAAPTARKRPRPQCLGLTQQGLPRHVLYLPAATAPRPYP